MKSGIKILKVKGGALYIAVMISIVAGVVLLMLLMLSRINDSYVNDIALSSQLDQDLQSAEIISRNYDEGALNGIWKQLHKGGDSISIRKKYWGAYQLISFKAKNKSGKVERYGLYGTFMKRDTGFVVGRGGVYTGVSGLIELKANCYLPSSGIKPAYIEGQSYISNGKSEMYIRSNNNVAEKLDDGFLDNLDTQKLPMEDEIDSVLNLENIDYRRSYKQRTLRVSGDKFQLRNLKLRGNIKLIATTSIDIDSSANLTDVVLIAPIVRVCSGFRGVIHVIADDSIIVNKRSRLDYPSSITLMNEDKGISGVKFIEIMDDAVVQGSVIAYDVFKDEDPHVFIKCNSKATVDGLLYTNGYLHLSGHFFANIYAYQLMLKTNSAVYENHILSCLVDPGKYAGFLAIPTTRTKQRLIKCKSII